MIVDPSQINLLKQVSINILKLEKKDIEWYIKELILEIFNIKIEIWSSIIEDTCIEKITIKI